ncbi:MAG: hypothetical protein J5W83_19860, partial [Candidatus Accumulibacter sp.]|uniref:flagellar biosynthesis regulator FlaF n=1 Tax=Accumulibacter sp. TaxID=2053492 RepID=UPI001B011695
MSGYQAYGRAQNTTENPRSTEYRLLAQVCGALTRAKEGKRGTAEFVDALLWNKKVWDAFIIDLSSDGNQLPRELRAQIIGIGLWVGRETIQVLDGNGDIDALITDSSSLAGTDPIDLAFEGKLEEIEHVALRSFREGINPSGLILLAINHAMILKRLVNVAHNSLDAALRAEGVFFRRIDRVRVQAGRWDAPMLKRAIETLAGAQLQ